MKKPNLFIIGAPKCGTTSLANWLSTHDEIFMCPKKEPHFYNKDHNHNSVINYAHYLSLFKNASNKHKIIAEASVWYLYSNEAITNIVNDLNHDLKFIVMLRAPHKMAYSLHEQQVFNMNEPEKNFKKAWLLQSERKLNRKISASTRDSKLLLYGDICKLGFQIERLFKIVNRNQVKIILLDEIKKDSLSVYKNTLEFLDLSYNGKIDFKAINTAKVRKSDKLALLVKFLGKLKHKLNIKNGYGILNMLNHRNIKNIKRINLDSKFESELKKYFREDVTLLEKLIDMDLSHWKS